MGASGLGALLVREGLLSEQDRRTIGKTCGQSSWAFAKCVLAMGMLDEDELAAFFAERTKYQVAPRNFLNRLDKGILERVDRRMISQLEVLPIHCERDKIQVAVADPLDKSTLRQLEFFTGLEVQPMIAPLSQIYAGLKRLIPDFNPRFTALSAFLQNHASSAWQRQRIDEEIVFDETGLVANRQARGLITKSRSYAEEEPDELAEESLQDLYEEDLEEEDLAGDLTDDDDAEVFLDSEANDDTDLEAALASDIKDHDENFDLTGLDDEPPSGSNAAWSNNEDSVEDSSTSIDQLSFDDEENELVIQEEDPTSDTEGVENKKSVDNLLDSENEVDSDDDFFGKSSNSNTSPTEDFDDDELFSGQGQSLDNGLGKSALETQASEIDGPLSADADAELDFDDDDNNNIPNEPTGLSERPPNQQAGAGFFQDLAHKTTLGSQSLTDHDDLLDEFSDETEPLLESEKEISAAHETELDNSLDDDSHDVLIMKTRPQVRLDQKPSTLLDDDDSFLDADFNPNDSALDDLAKTSISKLQPARPAPDDQDDELLAETNFGGEFDDEITNEIPIQDNQRIATQDGPTISEDLVDSEFDLEPSLGMGDDDFAINEPDLDLPRPPQSKSVSSHYPAIAQINQALLQLSLVNATSKALRVVEGALASSIPRGLIFQPNIKKSEIISAWTDSLGGTDSLLEKTSQLAKILSKQFPDDEKLTKKQWQDCSLPGSFQDQLEGQGILRLYPFTNATNHLLFFIGSLPQATHNRQNLEDSVASLLDQLGRKLGRE